MDVNQIDVLVVGAGPVGLFAANELKRHGLNCRIIDKKNGLSDKSKALGLHIRSLLMFENTGFFEEVIKRGVSCDYLVAKASGKTIAEVGFNILPDTLDYMIMLAQNETESIFYQALLDKQIPVEWQSELINYQQNQHQVLAEIKKENGEIETVNARWLLACDGGRSKVRDISGVSFEGGDYDTHWWLADVHIDWHYPLNKLIMYFSEKGPIACFPLAEKRYRLVMKASSDWDFNQDPGLEQIKQALLERSHENITVYDPIWISRFYIHHRQISHYRHENIFFAGDAAHIHSPLGAQGMNTGLQDIYNLVWKLALVQKKLADESILKSYHEERYPVGKQVVFITDKMTRAMAIKSPFLIAVRNQIVRMISSFKTPRKMLLSHLSQLKINYRKSPIVENHANGIKAGDLMPNMALFKDLQKVSLLQMLEGTQHHLLIFTGTHAVDVHSLNAVVQDIQSKYSQQITCWIIINADFNPQHVQVNCEVLQDRFNNAHKHFGFKKSAFCLIRPDQYLAFTSSPANERQLNTYLQKLFIG